MNEVNLVLRNKRVQLAELTLEIQGLEAAAIALRPVAHLLYMEEEAPSAAPVPQISITENIPSETAKARPSESSRIRRWV